MPALFDIVLLLLIAIWAGPSRQTDCGEGVVCEGNRPLLSTGCCPVGAGQGCRPANGEDCDVELGYYCLSEEGERVQEGQGVCQGRHNFRVTSWGENDVSLEWSPFAPADYQFEYVILLRQGAFHPDTSKWKFRDCGDQSSYTLVRLQPATLYFLRVAIWGDVRTATLANVSEAIWVKTRPVEWCDHDGQHVLVGHSVQEGCEENCTCLDTGQFRCEPVCPELGLPEMEEGCELVAGDHCCDVTVQCPVAGEPCEQNGIQYDHGTNWEEGCRACSCVHGQLTCLDPHYCSVMEPTSTCPRPQRRPVEGQCCPDWDCGNTCVEGNHTYSPGEYFTSSQCGLCQCGQAGNIQCATECPPVEIPVHGDMACPDPHVRQDGCCDTLYCYDPSLGTAEFFRRMFANSYSPVSLTLSFEVDPSYEVNGLPVYCQYEVLYANASEPEGPWLSQRVQPVDIRLHQDQASIQEPTDALNAYNAIVVNGRVYVTLSGMTPNTMYYVKIIPLDRDLHDVAILDPSRPGAEPQPVAIVVAVRTRPLRNASSCFHGGKEVLHGQAVSSHCSKACVCHMGRVTCSSACPDERIVMATSPSCPQPRLEKSEGECCRKWNCYPSASGCKYNGLILTAGQSVTDECQICTCLNASLVCNSACPPPGPAPLAGCHLDNVSTHCCPQWKCPRERRNPLAVEVGVRIHLLGSCTHPTSDFRSRVSGRMLTFVRQHADCADPQDSPSPLCSDALKVEVQCPGDSESRRSNRRKRAPPSEVSPGHVIVITVSLRLNFSQGEDAVHVAQEANRLGAKLLDILNTDLHLEVNSLDLSTPARVWLEEPSFICPRGFSYAKDACVLSEIIQKVPEGPGVKLLPVQVTSQSVTLQWSLIDVSAKHYVLGYMVQYRKNGTMEWLSSHSLDPSVMSLTLTALTPQQAYQVKLLAQTTWSGKPTWRIGETVFTTEPISHSDTVTFTLNEVSVSPSCVVLYWQPVATPLLTQLSAVHVMYKRASDDKYSYRVQLPNPQQSQARLTDLSPGSAYTAEIFLLLITGDTVRSHPIHFVTQTAAEEDHNHLLVPVVISSAVTMATLLVIALTCLLCKRARKKGEHTGFENKTYNLPLDNSGLPTADIHLSTDMTSSSVHPASD